MSDRRYDSEGIAIEQASPARTSEPEKLGIPAEMVQDLIQAALSSQIGNAVWRGFVAAHGYPSWLTEGQWVIEANSATVRKQMPGERTNGRP